MIKLFTILIAVISIFLLTAGYAKATNLENVKMQLRWYHQYQFAGFYAAKHKGFYEEAGFNVDIIAGNPDTHTVNEVLSGRVDFAEGNSEVLLSRLQGKPLVALAAIFQHSPSVLLTMAESGITRATQLKGKTVMLAGGINDTDLIAMFRTAGLSDKDINIVKSSFNLEDLISGKIHAFNSYLTNEPFYIEERGKLYNVISPQDYGIDFYSDILFTSEERAEKDPESVQRFTQASIKGWQYAVNNSEEIIQLIMDKYNPEKSLSHMRFEALTVNSLVKSELLPIGHIFPQRLERMADVFIEQQMIDNKNHLNKFVFSPPQSMTKITYAWLVSAACITLLSICIVFIISRMNRCLKQEINQRKAFELQLQLLADTDSLTKLLNRRAFIKLYQDQEAVSIRYKQPFSLVLLDLDLFKTINDSYGHDAGDKVLAEAAKILSNSLRDVDICARFGGEEFIALLPNTKIEQAKVSIERVRQQFEATPVIYEDQQIHFTASFGIGEWHNEKFNDLLITVDKALYKAKENGRNIVEVA